MGGRELKPGGTYTLTLKNSEGCDSIVRIKIRTNVTPMVPSSYGTFDIGYNTGAIEVRYGWDYTHRWSTGDTTYFLKNLKAGVYTDTITGKEGCIDTLVFDILKVIPYEMPNAFTPNDDGLNDWFAPVTNARCRVVNFKIFNRLGHLVYDNEEPTLGWDGKIKGQDAASDVYAYWIEMYFGKGAPILKHTGEVILIR